jgi:ABC-type nitrate/sulfonate/bicarbonate transport system permease component
MRSARSKLIAAAAHLSRWQIALSSFSEGRFSWPDPEEMCDDLTRLTEAAHHVSTG